MEFLVNHIIPTMHATLIVKIWMAIVAKYFYKNYWDFQATNGFELDFKKELIMASS